jgi:hypothetical protein
MSHKGSKGGAPSREEEAETGSLGKLREGLPEIGHDCFKDWVSIYTITIRPQKSPILFPRNDGLRNFNWINIFHL